MNLDCGLRGRDYKKHLAERESAPLLLKVRRRNWGPKREEGARTRGVNPVV